MCESQNLIFISLLMKPATLFCVLRLVNSFNIDTTPRSHLRYKGDPGSFLGYSLTAHKNASNMMLLVGAPRANSSLEANITEPGSVYSCPVASDRPLAELAELDCQPMMLGTPGTHEFTDTSGDSLHYKDVKDGEWLGVTMTTEVGANTDSTVVCGHKWRNGYYLSSQLSFLNGICYLIGRNVTTVRFVHTEYRANYDARNTLHAFRQAGASANVAKDGVFYFGSPGYYHWRGGLIKLDPTTGISKQITGFGNRIKLGAYLGYAVSSGSYFGGKHLLVAGGAPRRAVGLVHIITVDGFSGRILQILEGKQYKSYFGSALLSLDINHDGADDLLVGAPFESRLADDEGVVHIFYGSQGGNMSEGDILVGMGAPFGRFGSTIVNAKDIDSNGYDDVIIGSPYEDENRGAIYIFSGGPSGLSPFFTQRVAAADLPGMAMGFGMAVTGGFDIDHNTLTDIAVGSYLTDEMHVFPSRPVINVDMQANFMQSCIRLRKGDCRSIHGYSLPCAQLKVGLRWNTRRPESVRGNLRFLLVFNLTSVETSRRRAYLIDSQTLSRVTNQSVQVSVGIQETINHTFTVFLPRSHKDKFNPLELNIRHELLDTVSSGESEGLTVDVPPVVNITQGMKLYEHQVHICKDCEDINMCKTDVILNTELSSSHLVIGGTAPLVITVLVTNTREPAYATEVTTTFPKTLAFVHYQSPTKKVACQLIEDEESGLKEVLCEMGNPLPKNTKVEVALTFVASKFLSVDDQVQINASVTTWSFENARELANNQVRKSIPVIYDADVTGKSFSYPSTIIVDESSRGYMIQHVIDIMNSGPGATPVFQVAIELPSMENLGIYLEYGQISFGHENAIGGTRNGSFCTADVNEQNTEKPMTNTSDTSGEMSKAKTNVGTFVIKTVLMANFNYKEKKHFNPETHRHQDIYCSVNPVPPGERVTISYMLTVRVTNLEIFENIELVEFHTHIRIPSKIDSHLNSTVTYKIVNKILPPIALVSSGVPWYTSVVSCGAGLLLLLIIVLVFFKCGFFKRGHRDEMEKLLQVPNDEDEDLLKRQPVADNQYEAVQGAVGGVGAVGALNHQPCSGDDYEEAYQDNPYETLPELPEEEDYMLPDFCLYEEPIVTSPTPLLATEDPSYLQHYTDMGNKF